MVVWKYMLYNLGAEHIQMPEGAKILTVQTQNNNIAMWALVDHKADLVDRCIVVVQTGDGLYELLGQLNEFIFINTIQYISGEVVHVFERMSKLNQ